MKKLFLLVAMVVSVFTANAQYENQNVPENVNSELMNKFPEAREVKWKRSGVNYIGEFEVGKKDYTVAFDSKGDWISTDIKDIPSTELPQEIRQGINSTAYKDWEIRDAESKETLEETVYKVDLRRGLKMHNLYLDDQGNVIRETSGI